MTTRTRPLDIDTLRRRLSEFMQLTDSPVSDLGRLVSIVHNGGEVAIEAASFADDPRTGVLGWAVCERFRGVPLLGVYVAPRYRKQGYGTELVHGVLAQLQPGVRPLVDEQRAGYFWSKFGPAIRFDMPLSAKYG